MTGRALVGRTLRLALPLYLVTLVVAVVPTVVGMLGIWLLAGDRPWRGDLLGPGWLNLAVEMMMSATSGGGSPGAALILLAFGLLLPAAMLAQVAAYSYLAGGIIETLNAPSGSSRSEFLAACRRWFGPNLRLSLLGVVLLMAAMLLGSVATSTVDNLVGPDVVFFFQVALQALAWGWLEAGRAVMVAEGERSVGAALGRGARIAARPTALIIWLLLALPSSGLLLAAILPPSIADPSSLGGLLTALVFGQAVAFLGAWTKVIRLAVALRLTGARLSRQPTPPSMAAGRR